MDADLAKKLNCYNLRQVSAAVGELEEITRKGAAVQACEKEKEILAYLVVSSKVLIEGRDEGFVNNVRGLELLKFLSGDEAEHILRLYKNPDPLADLDGLMSILGIFADRLPQFKENLKC